MSRTGITGGGSPRRTLRTRSSVFLLAALVAGTVGACGSPEAGQATEPLASEAAAPDLTGVWEATSGGFSQEAFIAGSTMTINWLPEDGSDPALYWAGSFVAPTSDGKHTWTSDNDHGKTDSALLASGDGTKDFTFENGAISYEVSALGTTATVTLKQTSTTIPGGMDTLLAPPEPAGSATVVESGIGVDGDYAWVTAMVEHHGLTGEFATVLFNVYDEADELIVSEEQVELLGTAGTTFPIGTLIEIPSGSTVSHVKATVSTSDYGSRDEPTPVVAPVTAPADRPSFHIENSTGEDWTDPRIAIVCRDGAGTIVGGGVDFPRMIPAGGDFLVSDAHVTSAGGAASCEAYVQITPGR